jgi:hypothetical protein
MHGKWFALVVVSALLFGTSLLIYSDSASKAYHPCASSRRGKSLLDSIYDTVGPEKSLLHYLKDAYTQINVQLFKRDNSKPARRSTVHDIPQADHEKAGLLTVCSARSRSNCGCCTPGIAVNFILSC